MTFDDLTNYLLTTIKDHPVSASVLGLVLLIILIRRPRLFFGLLSLILIMSVMFYIIMAMAGAGVKQKEKMFQKNVNGLRK